LVRFIDLGMCLIVRYTLRDSNDGLLFFLYNAIEKRKILW